MTTRAIFATMLVTAVMTTGAGQIAAQQAGAGATVERPAPPLVPLKVTVTISRFDGEKKTASLPFVLWVNTGRDGGGIRMSSEVPVPTITTKDGVATSSYTYRSLGTNIDCSATALGDGLYRLMLSVEDTQVYSRAGLNMGSQADGSRATFQNFRATNQPILRDGQSVQFAVATDKTTGEVIKLDVMLNVVK